MNAVYLRGSTHASQNLIDEAIRENGAMRVLTSALLSILRGKHLKPTRPPDAKNLSSHLRRDIGLPREPEAVDWRNYLL